MNISVSGIFYKLITRFWNLPELLMTSPNVSGQVSNVIQLISLIDIFLKAASYFLSQHQADGYPNFALTVTKVFCDGCRRKLKAKQHQVSCATCQARFHKLCTNKSNKQYQEMSKQSIPYICLRCQLNIFPFSHKFWF